MIAQFVNHGPVTVRLGIEQKAQIWCALLLSYLPLVRQLYSQKFAQLETHRFIQLKGCDDRNTVCNKLFKFAQLYKAKQMLVMKIVYIITTDSASFKEQQLLSIIHTMICSGKLTLCKMCLICQCRHVDPVTTIQPLSLNLLIN